MKKKHAVVMKNTLMFLALFLAFGCKKETENAGNFDYFIFGTAYGKCIDNCVTLFKLEGQNLFADDNAQYTTLSDSENLPFQTTSLSADKVALAETLEAQIPANLYNEPNGNVGCPDCYDQGLYFVKIKIGDTIHEWRVDRDVKEYAAFCKLIRTTTQQLE